MNIRSIKKLFPSGMSKALTTSYDDGVTQDRKLIKIFNKYGIKGTFNINSGFLGQQDSLMRKNRTVTHDHIAKEEIKDIYINHEVAVHTLKHPFLEKLPKELVTYEVIEDRKNIEEIVGYPVRGMAYPYGTYNENVISALESCGIEYSRTTKSTGEFKLPDKYLELNPTCHHTEGNFLDLAKMFIEKKEDSVSLFYLWGHSYEFDVDDNWDIIEKFCEMVGKRDDIWYATNIEIVDYLKAFDSLRYSVTGSSIYNQSALDLWLLVNNSVLKISSGETIQCHYMDELK